MHSDASKIGGRRAYIAGPDILIPMIYRKYDINFN